MILTVEEIRALAPDLKSSDAAVSLFLDAVEQAIKGTTNNDFSKYADEYGEIHWPADIKMGVLELARWEESSRGKQGISSETISRHSVSYAAPTGAETEAGYPSYLMKFLDPYRKARF